jgi:hypothetical protein
MAHPLDGVLEKLARADRHLDEVKAAIERVVPADPDLLPGEFDEQTGHYLFRAKRDAQHPMFIAPVIGDYVHNTMAALDYLVVELVRVAGNEPTGANAFPVFTDEAWYRRDTRSKLRGIPPKAATVIERLQPFHGAKSQPFHPAWSDPTEEPLWHLYRLDKRDKHTALNLTEDVIAGTLVGLESIGMVSGWLPGVMPGSFERGAVVATLDLHGKRDVDVYLSAAYDVAFDSGGPAAGEPVIEVLDNIRKVVRRIVLPALRPFFPRK